MSASTLLPPVIPVLYRKASARTLHQETQVDLEGIVSDVVCFEGIFAEGEADTLPTETRRSRGRRDVP